MITLSFIKYLCLQLKRLSGYACMEMTNSLWLEQLSVCHLSAYLDIYPGLLFINQSGLGRLVILI